MKIGANNDGLKSKLSESESAIQKAFSANPVTAFTDSLSGVTSGLSGVIGKMSGLVAISAGGFGLGAIIDGAVNAGESVYQLSTKFGITAKEASELNRILKLTGSDTQTFSTAMLRLDKAYTASGDAGDKCRAVLEATGVSLTDSTGKLLPLNQQLENLSKGYTLAAASGQQEEFIMNTLGARGMALVGTLKNLAEAKEDAAKVTGAGLDPQQMHNLKRELDVISLQSTQVGLALTGALAPIASELFPPIMSGLKNTAEFLAANKTGVIELTENAMGLVAAYKGIQLISGAGSAVSTFWAKAAADAAVSTATQTLAADELSVVQEKAISRAVAASNKGYMKMQADAVKAAQAMGLSAEEYATVVTEKSIQIQTEAAAAAEAIRTKMTTAYLQVGTVATESATTQIASIERVGATAAEMNAAKTASTIESAELCMTAVVESSAAQVKSIETVGAASTLAAEKTVAANATAAESTGAVILANERVAISHATTGDAAILTGEKTVGAMATAEVAVASLGRSVWALMGGWLGLIAIMGYAAYKSYEYGGVIYDNYTKNYGVKPENYETTDSFHEQSSGTRASNSASDFKRDEDTNTLPEVETFEAQKPSPVDLTGIGADTGSKSGGGKSDAGKELEKLQKQAEQASKSIEREWMQLTNTKMEQLDSWRSDELKNLNESASVNENYQRDLTRLDEIYAEKKKKILSEQLKNSTDIWIEAAKNQRELNDLVSTAGITGVEKQRLDLQNRYNDALAETEERYKKLSVAFMGMDKESQTQYLLANKGVTKNDDGSLNFSKQIDAENLAHKKEFEQQMKDLHYDSTKYQEDLDRAYANYSFSELQTLLNSEAAIQDQYRTGQTALMKEYYTTWQETHRSSMEIMADAMGQFRSGMTSVYKDIIKGVDGAKSAWVGFRDTVIDIIADIYARQLSANLTSGLMSWLPGISTGSISNGWTGVERANGGLLTGPGTGTSDSILMWGSNGEFMMQASAVDSIGVDNLNYMNKTGNLPGFKNGGLVTGAPLSSISSGYNSAGVSGGNPSTGGNVSITVNNNSSAKVTATDGGIMDGIRQIIIDIAPDAVLNKASSSPTYSRNMKAVLG
ncbi:hypothetical protein SOV_50830 [Sporomusa ovata DSM 2662]|uniref:Phage tail length tape-measure protein 1 \|nr:hypothetical protein [Sporomusa ovata]EQB27456.1 hypothetical protein SOV_2c03520 [Sporomusa ovata DSM 2662]CQR73300.1 Phage tail length tape-measure protein 1 \